MTLSWHILEALRHTARLPCQRRNCGTVCKCGPCHARLALKAVDPQGPAVRVSLAVLDSAQPRGST